ncbi:hypothetical protein HDU98_004392 [Podochytrium sp. JEL0797]|nr:hypothetical protein HDU98_004392 [Podochytrium sp. JEL0797]
MDLNDKSNVSPPASVPPTNPTDGTTSNPADANANGISVDEGNTSFGLTGAELKKMEGWAFWRVRLSVPGTVLKLEDEIGTQCQITRASGPSVSSGTPDTYRISGIAAALGEEDNEVGTTTAPTSHVFGLGEIEWRSGGVYMKGLQTLFETDRFSFGKQ